MITNADILVEYQELLRDEIFSRDVCCQVQSSCEFTKNVSSYSHCVPKDSRCILTNVKCNESDRCEANSKLILMPYLILISLIVTQMENL